MTNDWLAYAACAGMDLDIFFPDPGGHDRAHEAKAICATCPVRPECLEDALIHNDAHGIRGGLAPKQRRNLRRRLGYIDHHGHGTPDRWDHCRCCACTSARGVGA